jgi:hypothetical protein
MSDVVVYWNVLPDLAAVGRLRRHQQHAGGQVMVLVLECLFWFAVFYIALMIVCVRADARFSMRERRRRVMASKAKWG